MDERFSDGIIILHTRMSFFEAVVDIDTHCTRRVDILYLDQMKITYQPVSYTHLTLPTIYSV